MIEIHNIYPCFGGILDFQKSELVPLLADHYVIDILKIFSIHGPTHHSLTIRYY